jgi:hypothetical protein
LVVVTIFKLRLKEVTVKVEKGRQECEPQALRPRLGFFKELEQEGEGLIGDDG